MLDIENFKEINDRWSPAQGDRCLREVAAALRDNVRQPDLCFRWGGDEFALILTGTAAADSQPMGERVCERISRACGRPDHSPVRIRFAVAELREGLAPSDLTELAGLALTGEKLKVGGLGQIPEPDAASAQATNATSST
jgi:diguanylate cyclase (GGDEF)-like protein